MNNFVFCQNDSFKSATYETYSMERNAKFGFVCISLGFDFVSHVAFDSLDDYYTLCDIDPREVECGFYDELITMNVGESTNIGDTIWTRCW